MHPIQGTESIRIVHEMMVGEALRRHRPGRVSRTGPREVASRLLAAVGIRLASPKRKEVLATSVADVRPFPRSVPGQGGPERGDGPAGPAVKESRPAA